MTSQSRSSAAAKLSASAVDDEQPGVAKAEPKDRLLAAALAEFAVRGFEGTTLASVARRCGVTQPLLHYHFGNKENLWREAVEPGLFEYREQIGRVVAAGDPQNPIATVEALVRGFVYFTAEHPNLARVLANEDMQPETHLREMVMKHGVPFLEAFSTVYKRAVELGQLTDIAPEKALLICAGASESQLRYARLTKVLTGGAGPREQDLAEYADAVVEICFRGLRPRN